MEMAWVRVTRLVILNLALCTLAVSASASASPSTPAQSNPCRCYPSDPCWPSTSEWQAFNASVAGNLIATSPIGSVCHLTTNSLFPPYNSQACDDLQARWFSPATHYSTSSSPMAPWFTNFSCSPFTAPSTPCTIGPLVRYAVNVTSASDVQATLAFAKEHDIRLVIRNTGHDYLGKSTGAGSLAIWTHHYKPIEYIPAYNDSLVYTGPAIRLGAGVQGLEALDAAHALGFTLVTGNCPTVGLAGGYTQGGGNGQLTSRFGMAADQVLEWEVVTADGQTLTATPENHADLFWALGGGGGGTFGVVLSMVVRLHPELETASAMLEFTAPTAVSDDLNGAPFWMAVRNFLLDTLPLLDAGGVTIWYLTRAPETASNALTFGVAPVVLPGGTAEQLQVYLSSTLDKLQKYNVSYSYRINEFPTFYDSYASTTPIVNVSEVHLGGRLIPRSTVELNLNALILTLHSIAQQSAAISGVSLNVSQTPSTPNAVNPAWRQTGLSLVIGLPVNHNDRQINLDRQQLMTGVLVPELAALTKIKSDWDIFEDSAYLNEADLNEPHWQSVFYGTNYDRLQSIKDRYDADQLFYARTAVGSQRWEETKDGRLCKVDFDADRGRNTNRNIVQTTRSQSQPLPAADYNTNTTNNNHSPLSAPLPTAPPNPEPKRKSTTVPPKMAIRLFIISYRKPGLSPAEFKVQYEAHADLIKRLTGDTFPLSHRRSYIARTTINSTATTDADTNATLYNPTTPATVLRGSQAAFDFDATAELTFADQAALDRFAAKCAEPDVAAAIAADEETFLEQKTVAIAMIGEVTETKKHE